MDNAERPLELAEWLEEIAECLSGEESEWTPDEETREEKKRYFETAAILRDYADLRRKWDAVVNAEPVAEVVRFHQGASASISIGMPPYVRESIAHGTQLIIKPTE